MADRHFENAAGAFDRIAFGDVFVFAHDHGADRVALEIQGETEGMAREFQHFALHYVGQAMHAANAI